MLICSNWPLFDEANIFDPAHEWHLKPGHIYAKVVANSQTSIRILAEEEVEGGKGWYTYIIQVPEERRNQLMTDLRNLGIQEDRAA